MTPLEQFTKDMDDLFPSDEVYCRIYYNQILVDGKLSATELESVLKAYQKYLSSLK